MRASDVISSLSLYVTERVLNLRTCKFQNEVRHMRACDINGGGIEIAISKFQNDGRVG